MTLAVFRLRSATDLPETRRSCWSRGLRGGRHRKPRRYFAALAARDQLIAGLEALSGGVRRVAPPDVTGSGLRTPGPAASILVNRSAPTTRWRSPPRRAFQPHGSPVVVMPAGRSVDGLADRGPTVGRRWDDDRLLDVATGSPRSSVGSGAARLLTERLDPVQLGAGAFPLREGRLECSPRHFELPCPVRTIAAPRPGSGRARDPEPPRSAATRPSQAATAASAWATASRAHAGRSLVAAAARRAGSAAVPAPGGRPPARRQRPPPNAPALLTSSHSSNRPGNP
jgi:hypothetical protein